MTGVFWASDFQFTKGRVKVHKTGADLKLTPSLLGDVRRWAVFYTPVRLVGWFNRLMRPGPTVWFAPDAPRPWYFIWACTTWAGLGLTRAPEKGDVAFFFDDATTSVPPPYGPARRLNFGCSDVSKSHVAKIFEQTFGYPLQIDPEIWSGLAVEKSELNAAHDGRIVQCPCKAQPGKVYQRLIQNSDGYLVEDLRTSFVDGEPIVVFVKRRPVNRRFENINCKVTLTTPEAVFSATERDTLARFARAMGLDWGGVDILRDTQSGKLYIVDVNKTDLGPPITLDLTSKIRATQRMAKALRAMVERPRPVS